VALYSLATSVYLGSYFHISPTEKSVTTAVSVIDLSNSLTAS